MSRRNVVTGIHISSFEKFITNPRLKTLHHLTSLVPVCFPFVPSSQPRTGPTRISLSSPPPASWTRGQLHYIILLYFGPLFLLTSASLVGSIYPLLDPSLCFAFYPPILPIFPLFFTLSIMKFHWSPIWIAGAIASALPYASSHELKLPYLPTLEPENPVETYLVSIKKQPEPANFRFSSMSSKTHPSYSLSNGPFKMAHFMPTTTRSSHQLCQCNCMRLYMKPIAIFLLNKRILRSPIPSKPVPFPLGKMDQRTKFFAFVSTSSTKKAALSLPIRWPSICSITLMVPIVLLAFD